MKKLITRAQTALATAMAFGPAVALAQGRLNQPNLPIGSEGEGLTLGSILGILESFAQFLITAAVIVAVIVIVYGGLMWMWKGSDEGKKILGKGIIGVAIVLGVGLILSTVSRIVTTQSLG